MREISEKKNITFLFWSVEVHGSPAPEISWIVEGDEVHLLTKQNPTVLHYTLLELVELQVLTQSKIHFLAEIRDVLFVSL